MKKFETWFEQYIDDQKRLISSINCAHLKRVIDIIEGFFDKDSGKIFICGNGGSLSNAQHFVCDLNKGVGEKIKLSIGGIALGSNPSILSAIGNDFKYEDIFWRELMYLDNDYSPNNILIGVSVSGNSSNVLNAIQYAKKYGMQTIAIVGNNGDNQIGKVSDMVIPIDSKHFGRVEDVSMTLLHMICYWFMERQND